MFKFSGGRQGESISDIHADQIEVFEQLMEEMVTNADELPAEQQDLIMEYAALQISQLRSSLQNLEDLIMKHIPDTRYWNGINSFRETIGTGPLELNNIVRPDVIPKIWDLLKSKLSEGDQRKGIDNFFQIFINSPNPEKPDFLPQKIARLYHMLNTIGYFPDTNVHQKRRFIASVSDNGHASMASFCDALLSRDKNFVKKVWAVYEYLEVPTEVYLVELIS